MKLLSTKEGSFSDSKYPRNTNILGSKFTNYVTRLDIHNAPVVGNFCDSNGKAIKPQIVAYHNRHMVYVNTRGSQKIRFPILLPPNNFT